MEKYIFKKALPVWETGKEKEMNYNLVFRFCQEKQQAF